VERRTGGGGRDKLRADATTPPRKL
jgi:hypothetical protein